MATKPGGKGKGGGGFKGQKRSIPGSLTDDVSSWWELEPPLGKKAAPAASKNAPDLKTLEAFRQKGQEVLEAASKRYTEKRERKATGDDKFMEQMLQSGTLSDRVSAMTLRVQQSPVHELGTLDGLLKLGQKGNHRGARLALEAMADLFKQNLLPPERPLLPLESRPLDNQNISPEHTLLWYFEAELKVRFSRLVEQLATALKDTVADFRRFGLECVAELLSERPEQEAALMTMTVNKLGDPDRKVASRAMFKLQRLLQAHPVMAPVAVQYVQAYLVRSNLQPRALYNGVIFLNQVYLKPKEDSTLAASLVKTYLGLFERAVKGGDLMSRLLSAILTGVNRAQPYLKHGDTSLEEHLDVLFRLVHVANFSASTQALSILFHLTQSMSNKGGKKKDGGKGEKGKKGGKGGEKTEQDQPQGAQQEPGKETSGRVRDRFYRALYAKMNTPDFRAAAQPTLFLNLLYKAMRGDPSPGRVAAFAKRLLQHGLYSGAPHAAAAIFLLAHVAQDQPVVAEIIQKTESLKTAADADDLDDEEDEDDDDEDEGEEDGMDEDETTSGGKKVNGKTQQVSGRAGPYDATTREPEASGAGETGLWEAVLLRHHFHPSVRAFAENFSEPPDHEVRYAGDPLVDFGTMNFLDKMAYRQSKVSRACHTPPLPLAFATGALRD